MTKFFKIKTGYDGEQFISIDETELESALYCFMTDSKGIFKNGVCRGKDIINISEDWHKVMGWNPTHELDSDDWNEIRSSGTEAKYHGLIGSVKEKIQYLVRTKQENLIGKNVAIPELKKTPRKELGNGGMKSIGDII